jgi:hypothetical protein
MTEIDVDVHDESVLRFVLSLPSDPSGTWLRVNGKTLFRVIPVSPSDSADQQPWTDEQNARRCLLIDKEVGGTITTLEALELEELQDQLRRYRRQVAPLPLAETRWLLEELERKASSASRGRQARG